jgi:hypothetical protein
MTLQRPLYGLSVICLPGQLGLHRKVGFISPFIARRTTMEPIILLWFVFFLVMAFIMRRSMGEEV